MSFPKVMANTETSFCSSIAQHRHPDTGDNGTSDAERDRKRGVIIDRTRIDVTLMIDQSVAVIQKSSCKSYIFFLG